MTDSKDDLGDRMKEYEGKETNRRFFPQLPVYARIDGRGFSKFTKGMLRPYDPRMTNAMIETTKYLVDQTHAVIGYVQSDEISLLYQAPDSIGGTVLFDGKTQKLVSVLASLATAAFTRAVMTSSDDQFRSYVDRMPHFDARVIQLPTKQEAANMFLWRNMDATKNAVSMAARHYYSHKELQGKSGPEMQEMLFQKGINFNDYPPEFKRGTFLRRVTYQRMFTDEELSRIPSMHRPDPDLVVTRSEVRVIDCPPFSKVENRVAFLYGE